MSLLLTHSLTLSSTLPPFSLSTRLYSPHTLLHSLPLSPLLFINTPLLPTHSLPNSLHLFIYPSLFPALSLPHPLPSLYHFASLPAHACTVHTFWTLLFCLSKSFYFLLTLFHTHSALLHALPFSSFIPASASGSLSSTLSFSHAVPVLLMYPLSPLLIPAHSLFEMKKKSWEILFANNRWPLFWYAGLYSLCQANWTVTV